LTRFNRLCDDDDDDDDDDVDMTRLTSFMISDILSETRRCHDDDDVTNDVINDVFSGSRRAASQTCDDTDSAAGDSAFTISDRLQ